MIQLESLKSQLNAHSKEMLKVIEKMPKKGNTIYTCQRMCLIARLRDLEHAVDEINQKDIDVEVLKRAS